MFQKFKYSFKELMAVHYKIEIYNSSLAKKTFLQPDLLALLNLILKIQYEKQECIKSGISSNSTGLAG
ncbi:hypothetical protein BH23BAC2_BH23BAC2_25040 [soil metagenome]